MKCPKCKSKNICKIIYGYINVDDQIQQQIDQKKIELGGCIVGENSLEFRCNECENEWGIIDD